MKITVFGASGKTGALAVRQALAAGHDVTAHARGDIGVKHDKLRMVAGDVTTGAGVDDAVAGADFVVACLGARTLKANTVRSDSASHVAAAMKKHGTKKLSWLSAAGVGDSAAQAKQASFVFGYLVMPLLLKANYADALVAEQVIKESGVAFVIVRPVGLTDEPAKGGVRAFAVTEKIAKAYIARADVAAFMLDCATDGRFDRQTPSRARTSSSRASVRAR